MKPESLDPSPPKLAPNPENLSWKSEAARCDGDCGDLDLRISENLVRMVSTRSSQGSGKAAVVTRKNPPPKKYTFGDTTRYSCKANQKSKSYVRGRKGPSPAEGSYCRAPRGMGHTTAANKRRKRTVRT